MTDLPLNPVKFSLSSRLEALLFVATGPVGTAQLAAALDLTASDVEKALSELNASFTLERGIRLQNHAGKYQLTTAPELSADIEKFLGLEGTSRLSRAALEALSIIAYQQPVTRPRMDSIRGVNSDGVLKSLLSKGLIQETGRADAPGRPILYGTTADFLQYFGLNSLQDLPPLELPEEQLIEPETREIFKD